MPPRPPLAGTAKLQVSWSGPDSRTANNICYAQTSADVTSTTILGELAANLVTAFALTGEVMSYISSEWSIINVTAIDNSGSTEGFNVHTATVPGTLAGSGNSPNVAMVVGWTINAHYRGGHPRWYLPGVMPNVLTTPGGAHLDSAHQSGLQSAANALLASFNGAAVGSTTATLGTISYSSGKVPRPTPLFRPFIGAQVPSRLGTQRRRLGKEAVLR